MCIDEFNGDNFDYGLLGFVGGGYIGHVQSNGHPISNEPRPRGTPAWGAKWKSAVRDNYLSTEARACTGASMPLKPEAA